LRIVWSRPAEHDLDAIAAYVAQDDPIAAARLVLRILHGSNDHLTEHPHLGQPGRIAGSRELVIAGTPYIVVYRVRRGVVEILRVLHGAQRWPER
jgi:toxin ParE1/3/4